MSVPLGVPANHIAGTNFIMVHLDLVDDLDGDFHAALLLDRIRFRAGDGWWSATREQLMADTRLNEYHLKRAIKVLRGMGFLETERVSAYDATLKYRVVIAATNEKAHSAVSESRITPPETANSAGSDVAYSAVSTSTKNNQELHTRTSEATPRDDVEHLCESLADKIEQNGSRRPTITKAWRDAARLMIDKDGIPFDMVQGAIDWSQNHEFWRSNILSMPKLREKYDQLRLQAERGSGNRSESRMQEHLAHIRDLWENNPVDNPQKQLEG